MRRLPNALYTAAEVRELDRLAIEEFGIPGATLMEQAGKAAFDAMRGRWPKARRIVVLVGTGNNGGDGFVVATLARAAEYEVRLFQVGDASRLKSDALTMAQRWQEAGGEIEAFEAGLDLGGTEIVVDGLLGTGLNAEVAGDWADAIRAINYSHAAVLALDIPSGLDANTGAALGVAVNAHLTVTFIGLKRGLMTGAGPRHVGQLVYDDCRVPPDVLMKIQPSCSRLGFDGLGHLLGPRPRDTHKGQCGHVLVIGGESGMGGAARLAAEAAARVGAGLVSVATRPVHAASMSSACPELMVHPVDNVAALKPLLAKASVIAIGPGLGQSDWSQQMLSAVLEQDRPMVIDADALNLLAIEPVSRSQWILTPHPGEAARLLDTDTATIQQDRFAAVTELQQRYGGSVILKGAGSLVASADMPLGLCSEGNPGMASGGMGDVLTGVIAGLLAQRAQAETMQALAARLGVCVHGRAADIAAHDGGERGLLASDVIAMLRETVNPAQFG